MGCKKTRFEKHKSGWGTVASGDVQTVSGRVCEIPLRIIRRPAHRENAAMNGPQLLMAHGDSSGLMGGAPAYKYPTSGTKTKTCQRWGTQLVDGRSTERGRGRPRYSRPGGRRYFRMVREVGVTLRWFGRLALLYDASGSGLLSLQVEMRSTCGLPRSYEFVPLASWPAVVRASKPALQTQVQFFNPALAGFWTTYLMARSSSSPLRIRRS